MKTVLLCGSPKKRLSASAFLLKLAALFIGSEKTFVAIPTFPSRYGPVLDELKGADNLLFAMPLYVDAVPGHILAFLEALEAFAKKEDLHPHVWVVVNNGFIEGRQNAPFMAIMENFSAACGFSFMGGLGIGGGVMLNVIRILLAAQFFLMLITIFAGYLAEGRWIVKEPAENFLLNLLINGVLASAALLELISLARHIRRQKDFGTRYTRILLPAFVFIVVADVFFFIASLLQGGLFRGWLAKKKPIDTFLKRKMD